MLLLFGNWVIVILGCAGLAGSPTGNLELRDLWAGKGPNMQASRRISTRPQKSNICLNEIDVGADSGVVETSEFGRNRRRV